MEGSLIGAVLFHFVDYRLPEGTAFSHENYNNVSLRGSNPYRNSDTTHRKFKIMLTTHFDKHH